MAKSHDMAKTCQSHGIHTAIFSGDHMELESVSAPSVDLALVPAPFPTADMSALGPVPVHSAVCSLAALLHPSFFRNRFLSHTVVLDRSHRACTPWGESSQRARERNQQHT